MARACVYIWGVSFVCVCVCVCQSRMNHSRSAQLLSSSYWAPSSTLNLLTDNIIDDDPPPVFVCLSS